MSLSFRAGAVEIASLLEHRRLPGTAERSGTRQHSEALDAHPDADGPDCAEADAQHVTRRAGFLNRVRKFDSCRGHLLRLPQIRPSRPQIQSSWYSAALPP
jgi:hypothetical protein